VAEISSREKIAAVVHRKCKYELRRRPWRDHRPGGAIIAGSENAVAVSTGEEIATAIHHNAIDIVGCSDRERNPGCTVISGPEDTFAEVSAGEKIALQVDRQGNDELSGKPAVHFHPCIAIVDRS